MTRGIEHLIQTWIDLEDVAGWAFVRGVPSTTTWQTVDYLRSLTPSRRANLCQAFLGNALYLFDKERDPNLHAAKANHPEFRVFLEARNQVFDWRYQNVRALRTILGDQMGKRPTPALANTPKEVLDRARDIRPTSANEIRKVVKEAFALRYGARPRKLDGGEWQYECLGLGRRFRVSIDYGGWDQLRYSVDHEEGSPAIWGHRLTYEQIVGAGLGHWNFLTADNLAASVNLLCALVDRLVAIPDELAHHAG
ncbi:MAG: hypothetical protein ABI782_09425 [Anaerolineaceae bacterium]